MKIYRSIIYLLTVIILSSIKLSAQTQTYILGQDIIIENDSLNSETNGKVEVQADTRVQKLLRKYIKYSGAKNKMDGYRVQIYMSSSKGKAREEAININRTFRRKYPEIPSYIKYEAPIFKVKVGDFRTKSEALKFMNELPEKYTGAYIIREEIELPKID